MNTKMTVTLIAASLITLGSLQPAGAFTTYGEWDNPRVVMHAHHYSFPVGHPYRDILSTIEDRIHVNPSSGYIVHHYDDPGASIGNFENEVWCSADAQYSPAVTIAWQDGNEIVEADVVFFVGVPWTLDMNKTNVWAYGGSKRPFQTTALHEYGHVMGLGHEDDEYNLMGEDWTHIHCNGNTARSYVGEDACDGLVYLYGRYSGGSIEDVSASVFEWSGRDGEYSLHDHCDVYYRYYWISPPSSTFEGQKRYEVYRGGNYRFEFTYENNGETSQVVRIGFYLSTNNYISRYDRRLTTRDVYVSRNDVNTVSYSVWLPKDLAAGQTYYLGVLMDDNNQLAEVDSLNNAAYHIIKVMG